MKSTKLGVVHVQQLLGIVNLNIRKFHPHYNSLIVINSLLLCWWWLCSEVFCKIHKRIRANVFFFCSVFHANGIELLVRLTGITRAGLRDKCSLIPVLLTLSTDSVAFHPLLTLFYCSISWTTIVVRNRDQPEIRQNTQKMILKNYLNDFEF